MDGIWYKGVFVFGNGASKNVIIFGGDKSSSPHIDNKKKIYFNSW